MTTQKAEFELVKTFEYVENYDEEWMKTSEYYKEYGGDSEEFQEQETKIQRAISEDSIDAAKDAMRSKIDSVFEADFTIENLVVSHSGDGEYKVTAEIQMTHVTPGFSMSDSLERKLEDLFDSYQTNLPT